MAKMYYEKDCELSYLNGKKIAIIGYGSQGHAHALNLKDSGCDVCVGLRAGSKNWAEAEKAGLAVKTVAEAAQWGDIVMMLINDEVQAEVYKNDIAPYLTEGKALAFAHGFNIRYQQIVPPAGVDVFMAAPKGPGHTVRSTYVNCKGVPCLVAVEQNATGNAYKLALAYIAGIGGARAGVMETTFHDETETDLFGEQTVLCGGVVDLMRCGFEVLVEAGYEPENAYFECIHEMKLIIDLINKGGVAAMNYSISDTAEFGEYVSGPRVIPHEETKARMRAVLSDIQDGTFAGKWIAENKNGRTFFNSKRAQLKKHQMELVGDELRRNMIWGGDKDLDTASNCPRTGREPRAAGRVRRGGARERSEGCPQGCPEQSGLCADEGRRQGSRHRLQLNRGPRATPASAVCVGKRNLPYSPKSPARANARAGLFVSDSANVSGKPRRVPRGIVVPLVHIDDVLVLCPRRHAHGTEVGPGTRIEGGRRAAVDRLHRVVQPRIPQGGQDIALFLHGQNGDQLAAVPNGKHTFPSFCSFPVSPSALSCKSGCF